jgi:hypothetical protein
VAEETEAHLSINDDAAPAFHVPLGAGQRLRDGISHYRIGTKLLRAARVIGTARNCRGSREHNDQRAAMFSRRLRR